MRERSEFKAWHRLAVAEALGRPSVDEQVDADIALSNLKFERRGTEGQWETTTWTALEEQE